MLIGNMRLRMTVAPESGENLCFPETLWHEDAGDLLPVSNKLAQL